MMDIIDLSARELAGKIRDRSLSAVDLMAATYDRIEAANPHVNAIVSAMDREEALNLARIADGETDNGPLHSIPIAIKDLANAAGFATSMGSPLFADNPPVKTDDIMVARMREAGALIIGKTNTPEFGLGSHTYNPVYGATCNPWDVSRSAGGSSGGAAVALATGMLALADGSDMMGSLRNPAGWNNVYGLRPTWGAVPSEPLGDTFLHQLATNGPMAKSPDDLALLLSVQAGPDAHQPHGFDLPPAKWSRPLRVGWLRDWQGAYPMEAGILECCENALGVLAELGHNVEACAPGFASDAIWSSWTVLRSWQVAASLAPLEEMPGGREGLKPEAIWELDRGKSFTALDIHRASVTRSQWFMQAAKLFETFDVLALPTAQCWPFDVNLDWPKEISGHAMDTYHRWMEIVVPAGLIGLPALAVPAGFGEQGLSIGVQLIGPRKSDYGLLSLGQAYHERAPWAGQMPQLPG